MNLVKISETVSEAHGIGNNHESLQMSLWCKHSNKRN